MITRMPAGATKGIVLLHGRGGSAADILSLLDHAGLAHIAAIAPQARGNSWWPTSFLSPSAQMEAPLAAALVQTGDAINTLIQQGISRDKIWLCGFSQGACLALEAYARQGAGLAGVFGFSGGLIGTADTGPQTPALYGHADKRLDYAPVGGTAWISVHENDPHIPLKRVTDSVNALTRAGTSVQSHITPGAGHSVTPQDIAALRAHLLG